MNLTPRQDNKRRFDRRDEKRRSYDDDYRNPKTSKGKGKGKRWQDASNSWSTSSSSKYEQRNNPRSSTPPTPPSLDSFNQVTPVSATLSSTWVSRFPASHAIDGVISTLTASGSAESTDHRSPTNRCQIDGSRTTLIDGRSKRVDMADRTPTRPSKSPC